MISYLIIEANFKRSTMEPKSSSSSKTPYLTLEENKQENYLIQRKLQGLSILLKMKKWSFVNSKEIFKFF